MHQLLKLVRRERTPYLLGNIVENKKNRATIKVPNYYEDAYKVRSDCYQLRDAVEEDWVQIVIEVTRTVHNDPLNKRSKAQLFTDCKRTTFTIWQRFAVQS